MKTLIKAARLYSAKLPAADLVAGHLQEKQFGELSSLQVSGAGFVPVKDGEFVATFEGGFAFAVRIDTKVIPPSAVKAETQRLADAYEKDNGFPPGRKSRKELKERAFDTLLPRALVHTVDLHAFYHVEDNLLIVPTSSKAAADIVTGLLIQAIGSVETSTLNVSEVKHGLTTRLARWLMLDDNEDEDPDLAFGTDFTPSDTVTLSRRVDSGKERLSIQIADLQQARAAIREALVSQFGVTSIRFDYPGVTFTLNDDFSLRSLSFESGPDDEGAQSVDGWAHEASVETMIVSRVVRSLLELLQYKAPATDSAEATA